MELTENMREWLADLYRRAAAEARGAADNEQAWADGSGGETREMHLANRREQLEYAQVLDRLREDAESGR